ncbi:hypothetical protein SEA_ARAXXI_17 [Microbacterium phage Araxxi]|uniref:Uncharacterized protein n=1 Tax=Microbacterium phage Araxxi TaxID=2590948 RepID=A0A516KT26_9CAUD|nr:hypothetical protein HWC57_gp17 [Microbacterium phage Araxxi]QDP44836.1 hypothetical protein SEA_ARAXXI_17 [Microbacterium phage Araxxi]
MSAFTTTTLTQNRVLVDGTDRFGVTDRKVLDATEYNELFAADQHSAAHEAFDAAVREFYAPLTAAVEEFEAAHAAEEDDLFEIVVQEEVAPTLGQPEIRRRLGRDTVILRLIDQGEEDRLIWIKGELEITAAGAVTSPIDETTESTDSEPVVDEPTA